VCVCACVCMCMHLCVCLCVCVCVFVCVCDMLTLMSSGPAEQRLQVRNKHVCVDG
jgi:hypothetical protein